ncbi:MAG: hypothetical protein GYA24_21625 [Candidatus Lokiarchaeota archaeon]|nr:hypothetical protein [Candidatus Lokiarchaeota archaeon]
MAVRGLHDAAPRTSLPARADKFSRNSMHPLGTSTGDAYKVSRRCFQSVAKEMLLMEHPCPSCGSTRTWFAMEGPDSRREVWGCGRCAWMFIVSTTESSISPIIPIGARS